MSRDSEGVNIKIPVAGNTYPQTNATREQIGVEASDELPPTGDDGNDVQCYGISTEETMTTIHDDRWCQVNEEDDWVMMNDGSGDGDDGESWSLRGDGFNQEVDWIDIDGEMRNEIESKTK